MKINKKLWFNYLVYLSFTPLLFHGISYLSAMLFYPFLISALLVGSIVFLLVTKPYKAIRIIKFWSLLILAYGIMRILLFGLAFLAGNGVPSGVFFQFTFWYHIKTTLFLILGYICFTRRQHYSVA